MRSCDIHLKHFLQKDHPKGAAIVYVAFKNEAESVANYLKVQGVVARPYHAGLDKSERESPHRFYQKFVSNISVTSGLLLNL